MKYWEECSKEFKFVIQATRYPCEEAKENLSTLLLKSNSINWKDIIQILQNNQLLGLCYINLKKYRLLQKIPKNILNTVRESYGKTFIRNIAIMKEIVTFLQNSASQGIKILPYKGIYLTSTIYKNNGARIFTDIDILVPQKQYPKLRKILKNKGFEPAFGKWFEKIESKSFYETLWVHPQKRFIQIDVHWGLNQFPFFEEITKYDVKDIWKRAKISEINSIKCYEMDILDQIISSNIDTICIHYLGNLRNFSDLDWIINTYREDINWVELINLCKIYRISKVIYYSLFYLKNLFNSPVPEWFLENIKPDNWGIERLWFDYCTSENMFSGREANFYSELTTNMVNIYDIIHKNIFKRPIPHRGKIFLLEYLPKTLKGGVTVLLLSEWHDRLKLFSKFTKPETDYLKLIYFIQNQKKEKVMRILHSLFMLFLIYPSLGICFCRALQTRIRNKRRR